MNLTGVPDNGDESRKFRSVPRLPPFRPLVFYFGNRLLDYQGRVGIISIVRRNLHPVIFGVGNCSRFQTAIVLDFRFR